MSSNRQDVNYYGIKFACKIAYQSPIATLVPAQQTKNFACNSPEHRLLWSLSSIYHNPGFKPQISYSVAYDGFIRSSFVARNRRLGWRHICMLLTYLTTILKHNSSETNVNEAFTYHLTPFQMKYIGGSDYWWFKSEI